MPVNPDAYMSGAIPSLSRGGSWQNVQDAQNPALALDSMSFASPGPGGSIYPRPSQIVPPSPGGPSAPGSAGGGMGNRTNMHFSRHPWAMNPTLPQSPLSRYGPSSGHGFAPSHAPPASPSARSQYFTAVEGSSASQQGGSMMSGRAPSVGPMRHPGWTGMPGGGYRSSPSSPTTYAPSVTPPRTPTGHQGSHAVTAPTSPYYPVFAAHSNSNSPGPQHQPQQQEWEWASGSPKPMTAEPDYFSPQHPYQGQQASEKHFIPAPRVMSLRLPSPKQKSSTGTVSPLPQPLPPPPQSGRLRLDSYTHRSRPSPSRRHTHDRFSPSPSRDQGDHDVPGSQSHSHAHPRSLGKQRRTAQSPYLPLDLGSFQAPSEDYYAPSPSKSASGAAPRSQAQSTAPSSAVERIRSQSARTPTSHHSNGPSSIAHSKATSLTERRLKQGLHSRPALPTIISNQSTVDFTSHGPATARVSSQSAFDLTGMQDALPPAPATASPSGSGYFPASSAEEETDYDRYTAHPAVPTSSRGENAQAPKPLRMDLKTITAAEYRPPCLPPVPSKKLKWNREGPAMKTHGVAWMRDAPEGPLPTGPQGPRWAQARPPNLDIQQDGNWWESGVG